MKILITGINGFIGQHLGQALLKRGHIVVGLGRSKKCKVSGIKNYCWGSVLDKMLVEKALRNAEAIIHLAALTSHKKMVEDKLATLEINLLGTKNVLDGFAKSKKTRKFLFPSTGKVYGKITHLPILEEHPTNPLNILGKSKLITEKLIDFYNDGQKEFIIFRIFNVYGPKQDKNFLIPTILEQLDLGKGPITLGDIKAKRDYVYIDDLARAFILAIEKKGNLGISTYNICTGIGSNAKQIVSIISKIKKIDLEVKSNSTLIRHDEMKDEYGSFELAKRYLGWKPKIDIKEGLEKLTNLSDRQILSKP